MANVISQIGAGLKSSVTTADVISVNQTYITSKRHDHPIPRYEKGFNYNVAYGVFLALFVEVETISGAGSLFVKCCIDTAGDIATVGQTQVTIDKGITDDTKGTCQIKMDVPFYCGEDTDNISVFFKTDAGTLDVIKSQITWSL